MLVKSTLAASLFNALAMSITLAGQVAYNNHRLEPFPITDIVDRNGTTYARLYVAGSETLHVDSQGDPVGGSGYYEALEGQSIPLSTPGGNIIQFEKDFLIPSLRVGKVGWDHDGTLTTITGLRPVLRISGMMQLRDKKVITPDWKDIAITSDVNNPRIENGNFYFTLEGGGEVEYWATIKFGKIVSLGKVEDKPVPAPEQPAATQMTTATISVSKKIVQGAQERLRALGYQPGAADGLMGAKATAALKKFQSDHSLPATGQLDQKTLDTLNAQLTK